MIITKLTESTTMNSKKLIAGHTPPTIVTSKLGGGNEDLFKPNDNFDWRMLVVYRGKHCPMCTDYLVNLNLLLPKFHELGVDVVAASADSQEKAIEHTTELNLNFSVGYELTIEQMQTLGLYISNPRSTEETDRPFAEPGLFVVNEKNELQIIDLSNAPFARPELKTLLMGLGFIRNTDNNYPIRGTH